MKGRETNAKKIQYNWNMCIRKTLNSFKMLSIAIKEMVVKSQKNIVLIIDEVDKSSNNQLFLSFLGMLRNKYLQRSVGKDITFHSEILAGVL